jgi:hypothetical protein
LNRDAKKKGIQEEGRVELNRVEEEGSKGEDNQTEGRLI